MISDRKPNRLIQESSPYLLQHAYNPVDWHPWGEEAFLKAKSQDKPLLISIGYSACHWCHVMERESFEDETTAALMNAEFICIKLDREEYPAVDDVYMEAVQAIAGNGGWPLNCFLLPDGKPFYGGTYFPPEDRYGRPGWQTVLKYISGLYRNERNKVQEQAERLTQHLGSAPAFLKLTAEPDQQVFAKSFIQLHQKFDTINGGFEGAPKFPAPFALRFLLSFIPSGTSNAQAEHMLRFSLDKMAAGGLYDQAGGGFHRYTVDAEWLVPHFEKMLYDNAALLILYSEAWARFHSEAWKSLVYQTCAFILREMTDPETGACYAALDADSEGVEGKFYTWSLEEIQTALGAECAGFIDRFGIRAEGNWEGTNILYRPAGFEGFLPDQDKNNFEKLMEIRRHRVRPGTDHKTLTSWNGLMLHAWATCWKYFGESEWKQAGIRLGEYLIQDRIRPEGLVHTHSGIEGILEDYACMIRGLLEGAVAWDLPHWLETAIQLTELTDQKFLDAEDGFYFTAPADAMGLIVRKKEFYDNAQPSGNALMAENLLILSRLTGNTAWSDRAEKMLDKISTVAQAYPRAFGHWLMTDKLRKGPAPDLVYAGIDSQNIEFPDMLHKSGVVFLPGLMYFSSDMKLPVPQKKNKISHKDTDLWYACSAGYCKKPVQNLQEAISEIILMY